LPKVSWDEIVGFLHPSRDRRKTVLREPEGSDDRLASKLEELALGTPGSCGGVMREAAERIRDMSCQIRVLVPLARSREE